MINRLNIIPNYFEGFTFVWEVGVSSAPEMPWEFVVQESQTGVEGFKDITPTITNVLAYTEDAPRKKFNKNPGPYFRIKFLNDGSYSPVHGLYGDLPKQEFLYLQEIMRKEALQMQNMSGVQVMIWQKMHSGKQCTECTDPITGEVLDSNCLACLGTRFITGFFGPYCTLATFSTTQTNKKHEQNGHGVEDERFYSVRMVGFPLVVKDDLIVDVKSQRVYTVHETGYLLEIRRIPAVQEIQVTENSRDEVEQSLPGAAIDELYGVLR